MRERVPIVAQSMQQMSENKVHIDTVIRTAESAYIKMFL